MGQTKKKNETSILRRKAYKTVRVMEAFPLTKRHFALKYNQVQICHDLFNNIGL